MKHVEILNRYIPKKTVRQVGYLQELNRDARSTKHKIPAKCLNRVLVRNMDEGMFLNTQFHNTQQWLLVELSYGRVEP